MWRTWWKWGAITLAVVWAIVGGLLGRELGVLQGTATAIENYQRCLAAPNHDAQARRNSRSLADSYHMALRLGTCSPSALVEAGS